MVQDQNTERILNTFKIILIFVEICQHSFFHTGCIENWDQWNDNKQNFDFLFYASLI